MPRFMSPKQMGGTPFLEPDSCLAARSDAASHPIALLKNGAPFINGAPLSCQNPVKLTRTQYQSNQLSDNSLFGPSALALLQTARKPKAVCGGHGVDTVGQHAGCDILHFRGTADRLRQSCT